MRPRRFEIAVLVLFLAIISYQLFVPPLIGLADNGDFARLVHPAGLREIPTTYSDKYFQYFNSRYSIAPWPEGVPGYKSSSLLFVGLARFLNMTLIAAAVFDVRVLGAVYLLCFLFGMYLILVSSRRLKPRWRIALAAVLLLMFTDPAYTAYFNSFYSEPTALVCLLLIIGCSLLLIAGQTASWIALTGYFIAAATLITAKPMYVPFTLLFVPYGLYLSRLVAMKSRDWLSGVMACALLLLAIWYHAHTPGWVRSNAHYIAVFTVLLKESSAPEHDARELGLKAEWLRYAGTTPYQRGSPAADARFTAEFTGHVSLLTIPKFFLRHPGRFYELVSRSAKHVSTVRLAYVGYYEKKAGKTPRAQPPGLWSDARKWFLPGSIWFLGVFFGSGPVALVMGIRKHLGEPQRGLLLLYGLLTAFSAIVFFVPALTTAAFDERYSITFASAFDVALILAVGALLRWPAIGRAPRDVYRWCFNPESRRRSDTVARTP